ncbi:M20/M25/M40 family metallo-hydrolase [Streptomyces sp. NPDC059853]|uniref:M20/M25/M40 family metallo-hydrolase n=1 Tax=Streptomyces sp. NPDC059853 TaxID=3346973 RepID=UPI00365FD6A0
MRNRIRTIIAPLAALPLLLLVGAAPPDAPDARADRLARVLAEDTTADGALRHLAAFQRIADTSGGHRAAGSTGHERSARYAGDLLAAAGYRVDYQRFGFSYRETTAERLTTADGRDIPIRAMTYTANTPDDGLTAPLAVAGGLGCSPEDYPGDTHRGRIALVERGECTFAAKAGQAAAAGAVAAVVYDSTPDGGPFGGTLGDPDAGVLPVGGISRADGLALAAGDLDSPVRLDLAQHAEDRETVNVLAETRGGDPDRVVMAGAHLDSVPDGPGINDNGSGSAGVLETALRLADHYRGGGATVRFALWSAEESGLLGSRHYVDGLTEAEREAIAVYLNFDMIASPNAGYFVHDGTGAPDGSAAVTGHLSGYLAEQGITAELSPFNGRSDYAPFVEAGIPAGGSYTGAEGLKTADQADRWGGTAGAPYDPCYHAACDDLGNIDRTALEANLAVIARAVGHSAWRPDALTTPR